MLRPSPEGEFFIYWHYYHVLNEFWKLQQVLGKGQDSRLEKWLKSRGFWHRTRNFGPQSLAGRLVRVNLGFWLLAFPYQERDYGLRDVE